MHRSAIDIFNALHPETHAQWLPGHFLARAVGRKYDSQFMADLRKLTDEVYLARDWPRHLKKSKHSAYSRTPKADAVVKQNPRRGKDEFKHQILQDMDAASIGFGIDEDPKFRLERWHDIILSGVVPQQTLDLIARGKSPHYVRLSKDEAYFPDGAPLKICSGEEHIYTIKEIDRATEPGRTTQERRSIVQKIQHIREYVKSGFNRTHYGFDNCIVRFITINDARKRFILELIKEEIGPCKYIGVYAWKDWGNHDLHKGGEEKYPAADGSMFHAAYERVGYEPYFLDTFTEMDR